MTMVYNVLEYCRQTSTPIIFSSSREVYGDIHRFSTDETSADFAFTESTYSASKIAGEALVYSYARCYQLPYIVFRFSNVYGRFDNDLERMERVIPLFIRKIARDEPITIYGPEKVLDFTYVEDCVDGIARGIEALASRRVVNQTINLAYGQGNTLVTMAECIAAAFNKHPRITQSPPLLGEVTHYVANIAKASQLLGYQPRVSLEEGIQKAVNWTRVWSEEHGAGNTAEVDREAPSGDLGIGFKYQPAQDAAGSAASSG
jgi:UDP-glucose 4-epimerase